MFNSVTLVGDIVSLGSYRTLGNGVQVFDFTLRTWALSGSKEFFEYHPITVWGDAVHKAKPLLKIGQLVRVDGALTHQIWEDSRKQKRRKSAIRCLVLREASLKVPAITEAEREKFTIVEQRKLFQEEL